MSLKLSLAAIASVLMFLVQAMPAFAQEPDAAHMAAAKRALASTKATESFDAILPNASLALKNRLANNNPDRSAEIDTVVDEEALALASRRGDLENEATKLFASNFTKEELEAIAGFFETEAGQKYLTTTPILARGLSKAARVWGTGIQRDLAANATKKLQDAAKSN